LYPIENFSYSTASFFSVLSLIWHLSIDFSNILANPGDPSLVEPANFSSRAKYSQFISERFKKQKNVTELSYEETHTFYTNATLGIHPFANLFFIPYSFVFVFVFVFCSDCSITLAEAMARGDRKDY
jgi:hypothetical protein